MLATMRLSLFLLWKLLKASHLVCVRFLLVNFLLFHRTFATMAIGDIGLVDPTSYSNPDKIIVTDVFLHLSVNFDTNILSGYSIITNSLKEDNVSVLILDAKDLDVFQVTQLDSEIPLKFSLSSPYKTFGSALIINLPDGLKMSDTIKIKISYQTSPLASGLQWLTPEQTFGKKEKFMFSQFQAIHARSAYPCQDTPAVKFTYSSEISAPEQMTVLMSGLRDGLPILKGNVKVSKFKQPVPIPSYLVALAVGRLVSQKLGPRCSVWAEPETIEKAAYEFAETEQMLDAAIELGGDYVWGVYDILVMPPSFPFGGMENPCITFATPTILAGDRSLANVVAHEISHSWSGNLVTTYTFEHFWLNEGFTKFLERKILGKLYGPDARLFSAAQGLEALRETIEHTFGCTHPFTKLVVDLTDVDPDDAFSTVPYEKGHAFLYYIEELVGGPDVFNPFLKSYFKKFANQSITTKDFQSYLLEYFRNNSKIEQINWDPWLYGTGMPPVIPNYNNSFTDACYGLSESWKSGSTKKSAIDTKDLSSSQISYMLSLLLKGPPLSLDVLTKLTEAYGLDTNYNSEIRFRWLRLGLKGRSPEFVPKAVEFINSQGRMKFVRPIYRDLYDWEEYRDTARDNYNKMKPSMMFVLANQLLKDLHLKK